MIDPVSSSRPAGSIQTNSDEVAIVIYDSPLPPKYFRLTKRFIRTLFVTVPLFFALLSAGLFLWGLGGRIQQTPAPVLPEVVSGDDGKIHQLENEIRALEQSNKALSEKLSQGPVAATNEDPYLMAIKKPYGMQNLLSQNKVSLDQFEVLNDQSKVNFKFQIISSSPENRVTGHVLVFMITDAGLMAWPQEANNSLSSGIKYSMGEPFAVSRLRPTDAAFSPRPVSDTAKFVVYIFSREGDLLLVKETENFKLGTK